MIKGVIFDMDGVLVDNRDMHIEAFDIFCNRYGVKLDAPKLLELFGFGNAEILAELWPAELLEGKDIQALSDEKEEIYREIFRRKITPAPGLLDFLEELEKRGYKLAVGTSGPKENIGFVLDKCGIGHYFPGTVVNGDMVERCKPEPDIYLMASKLMGLPNAECLVIEDTEIGIRAAHAAGCRVAALATTFPRSRFDGVDYDILWDNLEKANFADIEAIE